MGDPNSEELLFAGTALFVVGGGGGGGGGGGLFASIITSANVSSIKSCGILSSAYNLVNSSFNCSKGVPAARPCFIIANI